MFTNLKKSSPIRNDICEAYGPKRSQSIGAYHLLALVQDEMADYDEKPVAILAGQASRKPALLVLTSERLFLLTGNLFTRDVVSVPLNRISTSALKSGILGTFTVVATDNTETVIEQVQVRAARDFETTLRRSTSPERAA